MFTDPAHFKAKTSTIKLGGVSIKDATRTRKYYSIKNGLRTLD